MFIRILWRTLKLSFLNFMANRRQNVLSISTVILGSLAISAVFTVNQNVDTYVESLIAKSGGPNIFIYLKSDEHFFDQRDLNEMRSLASTRYVVADSQLNANVIWQGKSQQVTFFTHDVDYEKARPIKIIDGQFLSFFDLTIPSHNVVLSEQAVKNLNLVNPIGQDLIVNYRSRNLVAHVIGVAKSEFQTEDRGMGWISKNLFREFNLSNNLSSYIVGTHNYEDLDYFESQLLESQKKKFAENIETYNPKSSFDRMRSEYQTFINTGGIIGFLALLGGAVGVMNLMLMNVRLRTKEIGLYRALGFSTSVVLIIFIFESLITLNLGGIAGSILGCIFGYIISSQIVTTEPFISLSAFFYSFGVSALIGLVFSYLPALKASKMDTVEALRSA